MFLCDASGGFMLGYTWIQWAFFFFFYSFFGWCFESAYVSLKQKRLVNRGFIHGPFLPLYGSGGVMMLVVSSPFRDNLLLTYMAGCIGATALEYVTGVAMEALFKVRYWDYSNQPFNFQGQICLGSTLAWGGLTILMTRFVHKPVEAFAFWLPDQVLTAITVLIGIYFVADFALSFRAALDLKDVLVKMDQAKRELEKMQRRMDVIIAVTEENLENRREELDRKRERLEQRREALAEGLEKRFEHARELLSAGCLTERREELFDLRSRFRMYQEHLEMKHFVGDFWKRSMISGNPGMVSKKFAEALEELKKSTADYKKKGNGEE